MKNNQDKNLSIILLSFNDPRIVEAIKSIRRFDDIKCVRIVLIDGGSKQEVVDLIRPLLGEHDILVSEKDRGIFDGLNKGLGLCTTDYIGWIGSDDLFTGQVLASDVIRTLETHELLVCNLAVFRGRRVRRVTHAWPSRWNGARLGLHNPHYSTFGRTKLLGAERFFLNERGADIGYFLRVFARNPSVETSAKVATLQAEGGFSTHSYKRIIMINAELFNIYRKHSNALVAIFAITIKITNKIIGLIYFKLVNKSIEPFIVTRVSESR